MNNTPKAEGQCHPDLEGKAGFCHTEEERFTGVLACTPSPFIRSHPRDQFRRVTERQ